MWTLLGSVLVVKEPPCDVMVCVRIVRGCTSVSGGEDIAGSLISITVELEVGLVGSGERECVTDDCVGEANDVVDRCLYSSFPSEETGDDVVIIVFNEGTFSREIR